MKLLLTILLIIQLFTLYNQVVWNNHFEEMLCHVLNNTSVEGGVSCLK
jgi:hypothetical protein